MNYTVNGWNENFDDRTGERYYSCPECGHTEGYRHARSCYRYLSTLKPLLIPLKSEHYDNFHNGSKETEYRRYGKRWNENTCPIGRQVILSKGYGKGYRMNGVIANFKKIMLNDIQGDIRKSLIMIYGLENIEIAAIFIRKQENGNQ